MGAIRGNEPSAGPAREPINAGQMTFTEWLRSLGRRYAVPLSIGNILSVGASAYNILFPLMRGEVAPRWLAPATAGLQAVMIFLILCLPLPRHSRHEFPSARVRGLEVAGEEDVRRDSGFGTENEWVDAKTKANNSTKHFRVFWNILLVAWFLQYLLISAWFLLPGKEHQLAQAIIGSVIALCAYTANFMVVCCYFVLSRPILRVIQYFRWIAVFLLLNAVAVSALWAVYAVPGGITEELAELSEYVGALVGTVSLALFAGRLDSRLLNLPTWTCVLLYSYAALQALSPLVGPERPILASGMFLLALLFKTALFTIIMWLLQSGRLLMYFVRMGSLNERIDDDWRRFSQYLDAVEGEPSTRPARATAPGPTSI